jgi:hypothetical protein
VARGPYYFSARVGQQCKAVHWYVLTGSKLDCRQSLPAASSTPLCASYNAIAGLQHLVSAPPQVCMDPVSTRTVAALLVVCAERVIEGCRMHLSGGV